MRIGIDLGGTKIEAAALDASGAIFVRHRAPTPTGDYAGTLATIAALVSIRRSEDGPARQRWRRDAGLRFVEDRPHQERQQHGPQRQAARPRSRANCRPTGAAENDANCLALSEAADGAGAGARVVFGVILGTGVGGGLVVDGRLVSGRNRIAGEWGHNSLPSGDGRMRRGPACYCGKTGCVETFLSGAALARDYVARTGSKLAAHTIAAVARAGDAQADQCLNLHQDRRARVGLRHQCDRSRCHRAWRRCPTSLRFMTDCLRLIARYAFSDGVETPVIRAAHGDLSGAPRSGPGHGLRPDLGLVFHVNIRLIPRRLVVFRARHAAGIAPRAVNKPCPGNSNRFELYSIPARLEQNGFVHMPDRLRTKQPIVGRQPKPRPSCREPQFSSFDQRARRRGVARSRASDRRRRRRGARANARRGRDLRTVRRRHPGAAGGDAGH